LTVTGLTNSIFNHSAYMLNTKEEYFVNLYNFTSKKLEYELSITLNDKYKPIPDSIQNILYRNKAIESNKINALKYSKLIPIDIQNPYYGYTEAELLAKPSYSKITLWYYPDERFLSALPQDIREQIEEEMGLLEKIETGDLLPSEACEALGNKSSLLGLCSYTPSALTNVSIYPNPASDEVKLTFNLDSTRYVKVVLMDVTGNYQKDLLDWQEMGEGIKVIPLPLNQIHSGAYMLNIMTDKNERVIQKLIVK